MLRLVVLAVCLLQAASGSNETNVTSVTPTHSHTPTPTHSASHSESLTATPTHTPTRTTTATVTMRTPTETPAVTPSATLYTSATPIVTPSVSVTVSGTETATLPTPTRSVSATVTLTLPSATLTATETLPTPTESRTHTLPTPTQSSTLTATATATLPTPTVTTTMTLPTATVSWSLTLPTATPTETLTASASLSASASETQTASATASPTESATLSVSETQTVSLTETESATDSASVSLTATATAGQFVVMSYVLLEGRRSLNASWLAKQLFASTVDSAHLPPELMDVLELRVEAACHVPLYSTTPDDAAAASSHSYPDLERRIARIVGYEGSVARPEAWYDPTNTTHAFGINMGCAHVNGSWRGPVAAAAAVPLPEQSVVQLRNGTGASAAVLSVSCGGGVGADAAVAAAAAPVSATVSCGTAAVFAVRARVYAASLGREADVVRGALADFARDAHALPLRAGFPMPQLSLNPPAGPSTAAPRVDEGGGQSLTENFTLWLGIGGTVGALILGALLIIRLTKQGKMGQADAVNVMQDVYEDGVRGGRGGGGGGGGGVIEKQHRSVVRHHTTSDRGSSIARYEAWRQAVGSHMTGAEEVATPVPHYLPQEDDRAAASPPRPSKKVMSGYDNKPTPPSDLFELEAPSSPPVTLEHLKCPRPESTRYASLKDSYESNNPLRPAGSAQAGGSGAPAPPESDAAALEEQSLALLRAALKQKGIDLSGVSSSELRRSALQLVHARDNPLLFCGNCTRPRAPHFIVCRCGRVCYCDDDCKRRYYYYHKAECRA